MEGHGTNLDHTIRIEGEVHSLRKDIGEIRAENTEFRASIAALHKGQDALQHTLMDVAGKLDETRTRRPDIWAILGVGVGFIGTLITMAGVGWILINSWLDPIRTQTAENRNALMVVAESRFTDEDHRQAEKTREKEMKAIKDEFNSEHYDIKYEIIRLQDRVWMLEQGIPEQGLPEPGRYQMPRG